MSFLAPLFLAGGVAIALPVLFHLIRKTTRDKTVFSSLLFLTPSPPRLTRRSRLEHLLLLALRCLVLCLLALGFSRPFLRKPVNTNPDAGGARRLVLLVDTSASMRRADLWREAVAKAESLLRQSSPADEVAIFTFDRGLSTLTSFDEWDSTAIEQRVPVSLGKLSRTTPGWGSTHLGDALISAAEALADTGAKQVNGRRQIIAITDLQEGSRFEQLQGYEWPKSVDVSIEIVKPKSPNNASIQLAGELGDAGSKDRGNVRVRISNAPDSKREQFNVSWAQSNGVPAGVPLAAYVPPGQSRMVALAHPTGASVDRIQLTGDDENFDNTVFVIPPEPEKASVLYLGSESAADPRQPLYFLTRAFQETRRRAIQLTARDNNVPLTGSEAENATMLIVSDVLPEERARAVSDLVKAGKTIVCVLTGEKMAHTLAQLLGVDTLALEEIKNSSYTLLAEIDFQHPLFAPFADPRFSGFTKIHFWKYRRLDASAIPGARVVARFDNGDPAILDVTIGKGRVFIFTSGWQPEDSQLALSTKFVPLLYTLLEQSGGVEPPSPQYHVGDALPVATPAAVEKLSIALPNGSSITASGDTNFSATTLPGIYTVSSVQSTKHFAVNVEPSETRTRALSTDELEQLGVPLSHHVLEPAREAAHKARLQNNELENRQKLWRWFIVATLIILLVETWVAGRTARLGDVRVETSASVQ
jgi:hypothetical protein